MPDRETQALPANVRRFLETHRYALVGTVNPDGSPHQALVWYLFENDQIVVNSAVGRRWPSNLRRDPRVSVAVHDALDWVGLTGTATIQDDQPTAQRDIATMARLNDPPDVAERAIRTQFERQQRISFRLRPTGVHAEITDSSSGAGSGDADVTD